MNAIRSCVRLLWVLVWLGLGSCGGGGSTNPVASVRVTPETSQIGVGGSVTLTVQSLDNSGAVVGTQPVSFTSSNPAIATVNTAAPASSVEVRGVAEGVATIHWSADGRAGSSIITVSGLADIQVSGRVIDAVSRAGLSGAVLTQINGSLILTGADGGFSLAVAPLPGNAFGGVTLTASRAGYLSTLFHATVYASTTSTSLEPILLVPSGTPPGSLSGAVRDATNNAGIANATVQLYEGQGNYGAVVDTRTSDAQGNYSFANLPAGVYTVAVIASDYSDCGRIAIPLQASANVNQNVVCSPLIGAQAVRIVLTWGSNPSDLDAHLTGPNASDAGRFHVYYLTSSRGSTTSAPFAKLDTDERTGYGPETITLTQMNAGVYRFSVHDYSNRSSATSTALGNSGAKVELYLPGRLQPRTFFVPNQRGNLWAVFELSGALTDPTVTERNEMTLVDDEANVP
jgi:hypothetical protein